MTKHKVVVRSRKGGGRRITTVSLPDDIAEKLQKKSNKSDYVTVALREKFAREEVEEAAKVSISPLAEIPWTEEMNGLWRQRQHVKSEGRDEFWELENRWIHLHFGDTGWTTEIQEFEQVKSKFSAEDVTYLQKIWELPQELRQLVLERMEQEKEDRCKEQLRHFCGGDPDEIVWKEITRLQLMNIFDKRKRYTVSDVAGELGISYDQAYKQIVPFLKKQGITVS